MVSFDKLLVLVIMIENISPKHLMKQENKLLKSEFGCIKHRRELARKGSLARPKLKRVLKAK